jgi:hypothetical protein
MGWRPETSRAARTIVGVRKRLFRANSGKILLYAKPAVRLAFDGRSAATGRAPDFLRPYLLFAGKRHRVR